MCRLLLAVAVLAACERRPPPRAPAAVIQAPLDWSRPVPTGETAAPGYVGSAACARCHAAIASSYARHSMARGGLRPVSSLRGLAKLVDSAGESRHEKSGLSYRPVRHGQKYFVEERLDGELLQTQSITHVLSAGSYGMAFYSRQGEKFFQAPIDYYPQAKGWGMDPGEAGGNVRFSKPLRSFCISCHSDQPRGRAGSDEVWLDPLPSGIGCERCHGPGEKHAKSLRKNDIVNPARLSAARQLDVCAQCHLSSYEELRAGRHEYDFRPGSRLDEVRINFVGDPPDPERIDLLSHTERLVRSACWKKGKLVCTTCHDPHKSSLEQPAAWWDGKCAQCHTCSAKKSSGCPSCHMRKGPPANPPQVTVTDHWIQRRPSPLVADRPRVPRLISWPSILGEQASGPDVPALELLAQVKAGHAVEERQMAASAVGSPAVPGLYAWLADHFALRRQLAPALAAVAEGLRVAPDDRATLLQYARLQLDAGQLEESLHALDRLVALDANDADALELQGVLSLRVGRAAEAQQLFARAAAAGPSVAAAHVGLAVLAKDDNERVAELQKAHALEPRDSWILQKLRRSAAPQTTPATNWLPAVYR